MPYPRSAYDRTKGLVYFARMLDKIRLQAKGELREDYFENLGGGFDGRCCRLLGISYDVLKERVLAGGTDEEVLDWIYNPTRSSDRRATAGVEQIHGKARLA